MKIDVNDYPMNMDLKNHLYCMGADGGISTAEEDTKVGYEQKPPVTSEVKNSTIENIENKTKDIYNKVQQYVKQTFTTRFVVIHLVGVAVVGGVGYALGKKYGKK